MKSLPTLSVIAAASLVACNDGLSVDADGLAVLWSASGGNGMTGVPLVTDQLVVTGGLQGFVRAFDRKDGTLAWETFVGGRMSAAGPPVTAAGLVVVPQGHLVALDLETGVIRWRFAGEEGLAGEGTPVLSGDTVFTANVNGWVYAVSARDGRALWKADLGDLAAFHPTLSAELVLLGTRGRTEFGLGAGYAIALRKADGVEAWRFELPDSAGFLASGGAVNSGLVADGRLFIGTTTAWLYAIHLADGTLDWEQTVPGVSNFLSSDYRVKPRVLGTTLITVRTDEVTEGRSLADGMLQWTLDQGVFRAPPSIQGPFAYFFNGEMAVVNAIGTRVWLGGGRGPTSGKDFIYGTVTNDGTIYTVALDHPLSGGGASLNAMVVPELR